MVGYWLKDWLYLCKMHSNRKHSPNPNRFKSSYDFDALVKSNPELNKYVITNKNQDKTIAFSNPLAVYNLNKALLLNNFPLTSWDIPKKYLIPGVPGRAAYIYACAHFLARNNNGKVPSGKEYNVLDIGTGANMVYPIVGICEYGWNFVGADIEQDAIDIAKSIAKSNRCIEPNITFRLQDTHSRIFDQVVNRNDQFMLSICNPPFHSSAAEARKSSSRKQKNLKYNIKESNFRGSSYELWCKGGEYEFISNMIRESVKYKSQIKWFSTLISKQDNISALVKKVEKFSPKTLEILNLETGNKRSRILIWGW